MRWYQDQTGGNSSMRIALLICVVSTPIIAILALILNRDLMGTGAVIGAILIPAFGGKALQTREELKHE